MELFGMHTIVGEEAATNRSRVCELLRVITLQHALLSGRGYIKAPSAQQCRDER